MNSISEKVLEKIKREEVVIKPKWQFTACRYGVGILSLLFFLVGSLAISLILELIGQSEMFSFWGQKNGWGLMISSFPYLWLVMVIIFLVLGIAEFLRTRHGYKYRLRTVAIGAISVIFLGGWLFYAIGFSGQAENYLEERLYSYNKITKTPLVFWSQPEKGLISGVIVSNQPEEESIRLEDWQKDVWTVDYSKAFVRPRVQLREGEIVKVIGDPATSKEFRAAEIRPWPKCPMCQEHMKQRDFDGKMNRMRMMGR